MVGKVFTLAFVCAVLAQVQGNELENAINKGLLRAENLNGNAQGRIDATIKEVDLKNKQIQSETSNFVVKSVEVQEGVRQELRTSAEALEEKVKETGKPESCLECIKRAEENANTQIEILTSKFKIDMERLEKVKLANIETDSKPLDGMQEDLRVRYERAVKLIQNCQNASCVDIAVNSFSKWLDMMFATIKRVQEQVSTVYSNFQKDAINYSNNTNRQIVRIRTSTLENMKICVRNKRVISEEY